MTKPSPVAYAALGVALLALLSPFAGVAEAAGHKIGKNLVVTKSIKNDAVTGAKVKDGSLTAADLASGTLPTPGTGKSIVMASRADSSGAPNNIDFISPTGTFTQAEDSVYGVVPVAVTVSDLHVVTPQEGIGQAMQIGLLSSPSIGGVGTVLLSCTIQSGTSSCTGTGSATVPAGYLITIQTANGPGGSSAGFVAASYAVRVP